MCESGFWLLAGKTLDVSAAKDGCDGWGIENKYRTVNTECLNKSLPGSITSFHFSAASQV